MKSCGYLRGGHDGRGEAGRTFPILSETRLFKSAQETILGNYILNIRYGNRLRRSASGRTDLKFLVRDGHGSLRHLRRKVVPAKYHALFRNGELCSGMQLLHLGPIACDFTGHITLERYRGPRGTDQVADELLAVIEYQNIGFGRGLGPHAQAHEETKQG